MAFDPFLLLLADEGLPAPATEYRFAAHAVGGPGKGVKARLKAAGLRDWIADYAWLEHGLMLEKEGGVFTRQAHGSVTGILRDIAKQTDAAVLGWRVMRVIPGEMTKQSTIEKVRRALEVTNGTVS